MTESSPRDMQSNPFGDSSQFHFYPSLEHKRVVHRIVRGLESMCGLVLLTGEIGIGKTTLCRHIQSHFKDSYVFAEQGNPFLSPAEQLYHFCRQFEAEVPSGAGPKALMDALIMRLQDLNNDGRKTVIIIDEAHLLTKAHFGQVLVLSNLRYNSVPLVQIMLVGQLEIMDRLREEGLEAINQRIGIRCELRPLTKKDTGDYIRFKLNNAGIKDEALFTARTVDAIWKVSGGLPRLINHICAHAMDELTFSGSKAVTPDMIRTVSNDAMYAELFTTRTRKPERFSGLGGVASTGTFLRGGAKKQLVMGSVAVAVLALVVMFAAGYVPMPEWFEGPAGKEEFRAEGSQQSADGIDLTMDLTRTMADGVTEQAGEASHSTNSEQAGADALEDAQNGRDVRSYIAKDIHSKNRSLAESQSAKQSSGYGVLAVPPDVEPLSPPYAALRKNPRNVSRLGDFLLADGAYGFHDVVSEEYHVDSVKTIKSDQARGGPVGAVDMLARELFYENSLQLDVGDASQSIFDSLQVYTVSRHLGAQYTGMTSPIVSGDRSLLRDADRNEWSDAGRDQDVASLKQPAEYEADQEAGYLEETYQDSSANLLPDEMSDLLPEDQPEYLPERLPEHLPEHLEDGLEDASVQTQDSEPQRVYLNTASDELGEANAHVTVKDGDEHPIIGKITVDAVAWSDLAPERIAVLNATVLRTGDTIGAIRLVEIGEHSLIFEYQGVRYSRVWRQQE